jgi:2'-5' RNA ligase
LETYRQRLFIAVPLPDQIRSVLRERCGRLKRELPFQKWVHPDDYHITLKFLGDTSSDTAERMKQTLQDVSAGFPSFELSTERLGIFGPSEAPSILWANVSGDLKRLAGLQQQVEDAAAALGFDREARAYRPHITLARRYQGQQKFQRSELEKMDTSLEIRQSWTVNRMALYRSHLGKEPMYEAISIFPFETPSNIR